MVHIIYYFHISIGKWMRFGPVMVVNTNDYVSSVCTRTRKVSIFFDKGQKDFSDVLVL